MNYSQILPNAFQNGKSIFNNQYQNQQYYYKNYFQIFLGSMMENQKICIENYKRNQQNLEQINKINNNPNNKNNNLINQINIKGDISTNNNLKNNKEFKNDENIKERKTSYDDDEEEDYNYNSSQSINNNFYQPFQKKEFNINQNLDNNHNFNIFKEKRNQNINENIIEPAFNSNKPKEINNNYIPRELNYDNYYKNNFTNKFNLLNIYPTHSEPIYPPNDEPKIPPHSEHIYPIHVEPLYSPHGSLYPPHVEPIYPPNVSLKNPKKDKPIDTHHSASIFPFYHEPNYPPHDTLAYPPKAKSIYPPHVAPIYPPHYAPIFPPHGTPIHPPHYAPIFPPHGTPIYPPHCAPIFPPHGTPTYPPHNSPINPPHDAPIYPHQTEPLYPPQNNNKFSSPDMPLNLPNNPLKLTINDSPLFPPKGSYIYPDRDPLYLPQDSPLYYHHQKISQFNEETLFPAHEKSFNCPHDIPYSPYNMHYPTHEKLICPYGEHINTSGTEFINPPPGEPLYPSNEIPLYPSLEELDRSSNGESGSLPSKEPISKFNQECFPSNPNRFMNNNDKKSNIDEINEYNQQYKENINNNISIHQREINKKEIIHKEIPLYISFELNRYFIDDESKCLFISKNENKINNFPLVLINEDKMYWKFINFLEKNYKYREFNAFPILKNKLILSKSFVNEEQYKECHNLKNENIKKFANITNSSETKIYEQIDLDNIMKNINQSFYNNQDFVYEFLNKWIQTIINLIVEFIQFKLKKISYYYYCDRCNFPFLYISDILKEMNFANNNDLSCINNSINIYKDLIKLININDYNNKNKNPEFIINVIYYEEKNNYINFDFEEEINGTFIHCINMKSFEIIMSEIHDKNKYTYENDSKINIITYNKFMFELIISQIYIQKIFNYLINSNYFQFFKGICILIDDKEKLNIKNNELFQIKKKYANYIKDLYIAQDDIANFLKKEKENINYQNNKEYMTSYNMVDYTNYLTKYYKLHQGASVYYNPYSINSEKIIEKVFLDFLYSIISFRYKNYKNNDWKQNYNNFGNNKLYNIINIFDLIKNNQIKNLKNNNNYNKDFYIKIYNIIQKYCNDYNLFIYDFNFWLNNLDQLAHQKICYFIGSLMYNIDNSSLYYKNDNNNKDSEKNKFILFKVLSGNYIDLMFYERHKNQIITFNSFLFCSEKVNKKNYMHKQKKYSILFRINYNLKNKNKYIPIMFDLFYSKIFQLFTFFKIKDIKIRNNIEKAIIDLEPINKIEYLEIKLKENEKIYYNPNSNIMEHIFNENNFNNNNSNINQSNFSNNNNQNNLYITSAPIHSKYLRYFNNQFNKNLNIDMTSILLENSDLKDIGLLVLSKIKFKELIVLNLDNNRISNLSPLKDCNFPKLKKLSLNSNDKTPFTYKIKDISPLINSKFPDLFILNLRNNIINDISYLLFMNFPNLIILDLSYNKIQSIHAFSSVNFPKLETLDLCNNQIQDITPLVYSYRKRNKVIKIIENNPSKKSSIIPSNNVHIVLPNLKILKLKNNKLNIDEGYLMTIKSLRNRGIMIFK